MRSNPISEPMLTSIYRAGGARRNSGDALRAALVAAFFTMAPLNAFAVEETVSTFDGGDPAGWWTTGIPGPDTFIDVSDGVPAPALRTSRLATFITFRNAAAAWTGNYAAFASGGFTFAVDVHSHSVRVGEQDVTSPLVLQLRDYDDAGAYPWVSVYFTLGEIGTESVNGQPGWHTLFVSVVDPSAEALPEGWGGTGDEPPPEFTPALPPGRTFASVLAGVDEVALVTLVPGFLSLGVDYDLAVDNIRLIALPEPGGMPIASAGAATTALLARRRFARRSGIA